jgi:hypothetical protein
VRKYCYYRAGLDSCRRERFPRRFAEGECRRPAWHALGFQPGRDFGFAEGKSGKRLEAGPAGAVERQLSGDYLSAQCEVRAVRARVGATVSFSARRV